MNGLLMIGSAKRPRSTSEVLGAYLLERLAERGFETGRVLLPRAVRSEDGRAALLEAVAQADLVILSFPLYVDSLPAPAIHALELISEARGEGGLAGKRLVALSNCGFPEARHNETALAVCRHFAEGMGMAWAGGLALGGGQAINGRALTDLGGMARDVIAALDRTVEALAEGGDVPPEAVERMAQPLTPAWMYVRLGGLGWRFQAMKHGAHRQIHARPHLE
jgi:NAD(P)H-dependent FMN reductase